MAKKRPVDEIKPMKRATALFRLGSDRFVFNRDTTRIGRAITRGEYNLARVLAKRLVMVAEGTLWAVECAAMQANLNREKKAAKKAASK